MHAVVLIWRVPCRFGVQACTRRALPHALGCCCRAVSHLICTLPGGSIGWFLQDWDVFYLKIGCCSKLGQNVSTHLVPVYGAAGAFAYMMTPAFARKALQVVRSPRINSWLDVILMSMGRHFECNMYGARTPLIGAESGFNSTLTHYTETSKENHWEQKYMEYGHWGPFISAAASWF